MSLIVPSGSGFRFVGEVDETCSQPTGHVEEMELRHVDGEPPHLAGERREERVAERWLGRDQLAECLPWNDDRLGRDERGRARRTRRAIEQRDLAEDVAGAQGRQDRLVTRLGRQRDLDLAGDDDEQCLTRVAGMEDDLAATEPARPRSGRNPVEGGRFEPGEERDPGK